MSARFLRTFPCQDACGVLLTDLTVEGAPVYRCPGCDTEWIELDELGQQEAVPPTGGPPGECRDDPTR